MIDNTHKSKITKEIYEFIAALTLTDLFLIEYLSEHASGGLSTIISMLLLYTSAFIGVMRIALDKKKYIPAIIVVLFILVLCQYERSVTSREAGEYISRFMVHSIGGFIIGLGVRNYYALVKYASWVACIYGLFLIMEPITHSLLPNMSAMSIGYIISPLVIWIIMGRFLNACPQWTFLICVPLAITTILFTSRGCGLSIISALLVYYYFKKNIMAKPIKIIGVALVVFLAFQFFFDYFASKAASLEYGEGSLLEKISHGYADSDNGRTDIWTAGIGIIESNWLSGTGIAMDRDIGSFVFVHNIVLELMIHFGIPLGVLMLILYWTSYLRKFNTFSSSHKFLLIGLACMFWIKLLFSDSYLSNMMGLMFMFGLSFSIRYAPTNQLLKFHK